MARLADLSSPELRDLLREGALALLPVGSTEAHGPHLPLDTDVLIAEETCARAVGPVEAALGLHPVILPALAFSLAEFAGPFPGTLSLRRETFLGFLADLIRSTLSQGFSGLVLVNAHLEPAHRFVLRDAVQAARDAGLRVALADPAERRFASRLTEEFQSGSCHAGCYETSLVLAAAPSKVRREAQRSLPPLQLDLVKEIRAGSKSLKDAGAADGYCGAPGEASREEGERSYRLLVDIVVEVSTELITQGGPTP